MCHRVGPKKTKKREKHLEPINLSRKTEELLYNLVIPFPGIYPQKTPKTLIRKDVCTTMLTAALFTIGKTWKQPKCPLTDEWIKKLWCVDG